MVIQRQTLSPKDRSFKELLCLKVAASVGLSTGDSQLSSLSSAALQGPQVPGRPMRHRMKTTSLGHFTYEEERNKKNCSEPNHLW